MDYNLLHRRHCPVPPSCFISSVVIRRRRCRIFECTPGSTNSSPSPTLERTASARVRLGGQTEACHTGPPNVWAVSISMSQVSITLRQVHAHRVGFIRDVDFMRVRQCRTLPGSKFFRHMLLLFGITLPCHSLHCVCIADHRRLTRPTLCFAPAWRACRCKTAAARKRQPQLNLCL